MSLRILELRFGPSFPQELASTAQVYFRPIDDGPGELWDEEDELKFPSFSHAKPISRLNRARHTWAAGVTYWHQSNDIGELWDDEDDRRISVGKCSDAETTLVASLSVLSIGSQSEFAVNLPSFISIRELSALGLTGSCNSVAPSKTLEKSLTVTLSGNLCASTDEVGSAFIEETVSETGSEHVDTCSNVGSVEVSPEPDKVCLL